MRKLFLILFFFISFEGYTQFYEDFEVIPGSTTDWELNSGIWTIVNNFQTDLFWDFNTSPNLVFSGLRSAFKNRYNIGQGNFSYDYLVSPQIYIPWNASLKFWSRTLISGNQGTIFKIKILPSPYLISELQNYPDFATFNEATLSQVYNQYEEKILSLSSFAGQNVRIVFVRYFYQSTPALGGDGWLLDDVSVTCYNPVPEVSNQSFCDNATISDIVISGNDIRWYEFLSSGLELSPSHNLIDGHTYYATQTYQGCESSRVPCTITINQVDPPLGSPQQSFIPGQIVNDLNVSGTNITWYNSILDAFNNVNPISILTPLVDGESYCANQFIDNCQSAVPLCVTVGANLATFSKEKDSFLVYPNPANQEIILKVEKSNLIDKIVIKDITGKILIVQNKLSNNINIETLEKGVYFIEAYSNKQKHQTKFIKQ